MHFYKKNAKKNFLLYEKIINHSPLQRHTLTYVREPSPYE